jgi:hypothetical protein
MVLLVQTGWHVPCARQGENMRTLPQIVFLATISIFVLATATADRRGLAAPAPA